MVTHAMKLPVQSFCADVNVRGGLELCRYRVSRGWQLLRIMCLSTQRPSFVTLSCCVPNAFQFVIIPLAVELVGKKLRKLPCCNSSILLQCYAL